MDDVFIKVIRYAVDKNGPFDLITMFSELNVSEQQQEMLMDQIANRHLLSHSTAYIPSIVYAIVEKKNKEMLVWCSAIDRFRLLEYEELKEARESSIDANKTATRAIWLSIVTLLCSIFFSLYQVITPISLPIEFNKEISNIGVLLKESINYDRMNKEDSVGSVQEK
ncbi:hypothetical protein VIBRN418_16266 [Vibrio sp. N418]|uniref:hypothetical protein n=1 Tax=Vibrio sp. (strain N418) TaxID=701176 RepID=UPI00021BDF8E|nr:hypothetical protein [Vibrio sp. N418]EGU30858.1 hypothetical protein VIBRN418_16266 [Vibrio sp. N418]